VAIHSVANELREQGVIRGHIALQLSPAMGGPEEFLREKMMLVREGEQTLERLGDLIPEVSLCTFLIFTLKEFVLMVRILS